MPGIAGIIRRHRYEGIRQDLHLMVEAMRHETFYAGSCYVNPDVGLYVGWLDQQGSLVDYLPLITGNKGTVLVFGGEPHPNNPDDLLRLYEKSGNDFTECLNGWFCGLIADLNVGTITLFNDRYGMSRVYIHEGTDELLFASEAKSILRVRPELRRIQPEALAEYLRFGCVTSDKTLFKGVSLLPSGSSWVFENGGSPRKCRYFDFSAWERQPSLEADEFHQQFADTVSRVFPAYRQGRPRVGLSLTAGLDTRTILASIHEPNGALPCYTFGGAWGETFDIRTARKLAAICHQPHDVIRLNRTFFRNFPDLAHESVYISDGTHDAFGAHDLYFNRIARGIAPVRLTGKFGSEVVRVGKLIASADVPRRLVQAGFARFLEQVPSLADLTHRAHPLSRVVSEEIPWSQSGRLSVEQSQVIFRTPYMDNELVRLMYQAPHHLRLSRNLQVRYIADKRPELTAPLTDLGRVGNDAELVNKLIYVPLRALFKAEYIYLFAAPHWLTWMDRKLEALKPERILAGRQKFEGYRIWIKTELADFVCQTLLNPSARYTEFFDKIEVSRMVGRHTAGTHNYLGEIDKILTVELICGSLLVSPSPQPVSLPASPP